MGGVEDVAYEHKESIKERRATYFGGAFLMLLLLLGRSITDFHDWHTLLLTITALVSLFLFDIEDKKMQKKSQKGGWPMNQITIFDTPDGRSENL